jgi:hypothetical protein
MHDAPGLNVCAWQFWDALNSFVGGAPPNMLTVYEAAPV